LSEIKAVADRCWSKIKRVCLANEVRLLPSLSLVSITRNPNFPVRAASLQTVDIRFLSKLHPADSSSKPGFESVCAKAATAENAKAKASFNLFITVILPAFRHKGKAEVTYFAIGG